MNPLAGLAALGAALLLSKLAEEDEPLCAYWLLDKKSSGKFRGIPLMWWSSSEGKFPHAGSACMSSEAFFEEDPDLPPDEAQLLVEDAMNTALLGNKSRNIVLDPAITEDFAPFTKLREVHGHDRLWIGVPRGGKKVSTSSKGPTTRARDLNQFRVL